MTIGQRIKTMREIRNYTQEYLADMLGITQQAYGKIECNKTDITLKRLEQIAHILDVDVVFLIQWEDTHYMHRKSQHKALSFYDNQETYPSYTRVLEHQVTFLTSLLCQKFGVTLDTSIIAQHHKQNPPKGADKMPEHL